MGRAQEKIAREGGSVRYSARVEYDGTDFAGFQVQPGERTVQGELERVLAAIFGGQRIKVDGAGRTDAGVHARGQVIAFTVPTELGRDELQAAVNGLLPADVSIGDSDEVASDFRPRYRARHREYRYRIWNGTTQPAARALRLRRARRARCGANARGGAGLRRRARLLTIRWQGQAAGKDAAPASRCAGKGQLITIVVVGDAFLRGMVRRIAAALIRVGKGKASVEDVRRALAAKSRRSRARPRRHAD